MSPQKHRGITGESIYYNERDDHSYFEDENFDIKHDQPGIVSMWKPSHREHVNGSQFMILLHPMDVFDGQNTAFVKVIEGMDVLEQMSLAGFTHDVNDHGQGGAPHKNVKVKASGELVDYDFDQDMDDVDVVDL